MSIIRDITVATPRKAFTDEELHGVAPPTTTVSSIMEEKFGSKELEEIAELARTAEEQIKAGMADGTWDTSDTLAMAGSLVTTLIPAISNIGGAVNEARNLNREEIKIIRDKIDLIGESATGDLVEGLLFLETAILKLTGQYIANE